MSSIQLSTNDITFVNHSCTKHDIINLVAEKMIEGGLVKSDYTQAMLDRDAQISTFLGNGIAIPHGTTDKRDSVINTGLKVLFCPEGVVWDEDNQVAYVIVGIAAKAEEHLNVLRQLTHAVIAEDTLERIKLVKTPEDLLDILQNKSS